MANKRFSAIFFVQKTFEFGLQFLPACCVNFRVISNNVTINEKPCGTLEKVLVLYFAFENRITASPPQKAKLTSVAFICLLFFMIPVLNFMLFVV